MHRHGVSIGAAYAEHGANHTIIHHDQLRAQRKNQVASTSVMTKSFDIFSSLRTAIILATTMLIVVAGCTATTADSPVTAVVTIAPTSTVDSQPVPTATTVPTPLPPTATRVPAPPAPTPTLVPADTNHLFHQPPRSSPQQQPFQLQPQFRLPPHLRQLKHRCLPQRRFLSQQSQLAHCPMA